MIFLLLSISIAFFTIIFLDLFMEDTGPYPGRLLVYTFYCYGGGSEVFQIWGMPSTFGPVVWSEIYLYL